MHFYSRSSWYEYYRRPPPGPQGGGRICIQSECFYSPSYLYTYLAEAKDVDGQGGARRQRDEGRDSALQLGRGVTLRTHLCMCMCSLLEALRRALLSA